MFHVEHRFGAALEMPFIERATSAMYGRRDV